MGQDLSVLCPPPKDKDEAKIYRAMSSVIRKVVVNAAIHRSHADVMEEVYLAGLWHGMKLSGPPDVEPRKPDYLDLTPPRVVRRGRPRKTQATRP